MTDINTPRWHTYQDANAVAQAKSGVDILIVQVALGHLRT